MDFRWGAGPIVTSAAPLLFSWPQGQLSGLLNVARGKGREGISPLMMPLLANEGQGQLSQAYSFRAGSQAPLPPGLALLCCLAKVHLLHFLCPDPWTLLGKKMWKLQSRFYWKISQFFLNLCFPGFPEWKHSPGRWKIEGVCFCTHMHICLNVYDLIHACMCSCE